MLSVINEIEAMAADDPQPATFRGLRQPIEVSPGTMDLVWVLDAVVREEYGQHGPQGEICSLLEAGAFVCDTSTWYLSRYPGLGIWSLEPNPDNIWLAQRKLKPRGARANVQPLALASKRCRVRSGGEATGDAIASDGIEVGVPTVPELRALILRGRVDSLKTDIDGAELDVFTNDAEAWPDKFGLIIVGLHGREIEREVLAEFPRNDFTVEQYRSVWC